MRALPSHEYGTRATANLAKVDDGFVIEEIAFETDVEVGGIDKSKFREEVEEPNATVPISRAIAGTKITRGAPSLSAAFLVSCRVCMSRAANQDRPGLSRDETALLFGLLAGADRRDLSEHLHADHVGGIAPQGNSAFPNAIVRVNQKDRDYWLDVSSPTPQRIAACRSAPSRLGTTSTAETKRLGWSKTANSSNDSGGEKI